jgi:hypothetical protein
MTHPTKKLIFLPRASFFEIETRLTEDAVKKTLEASLAKAHSFNPFYVPLDDAFVGEVYAAGFDVKLDVWYNRGFNPVFHGFFKKTDKGVTVQVKASSELATFGAVFGWLCSIVTLAAAFINVFHRSFHSAGIAFYVGIGILAMTVLSARVYDRTIRKGRERLISMLQTRKDRSGGAAAFPGN